MIVRYYKSIYCENIIRDIFLFILFICILSGSGGFDNGTSTGKGKIQLDLTWNPFNYWDKGQSYAVLSYGVFQRIDIHG